MKITQLHPLISCICITGYRPEMLIKSFVNFEQQNYPNIEFVVSYPQDDYETSEILKVICKQNRLSTIEIVRKSQQTIGAARNEAISKSNGEYICMWDDDDIHQYNRIADQHNLLHGSGRYFQGSIISQIVLYDGIGYKAFQSFSNVWGGTLLCRKEHIIKYPCTNSNHFDCMPVVNFLRKERLLLTDLLNPMLYIHVYHGTNITDYYHFQYYLKKSIPLPEALSMDIQKYLDQSIKIYNHES